jgi:hypothetical protein
MIKILEQTHISQQFDPTHVMMINNTFMPRTCKTHCFYVTKESLNDINEIISEFSKNPLIDCDTSDVAKVASIMQQGEKKILVIQWITDLQDSVLKNYFHLTKNWDGQKLPNTRLHTAAFCFEEVG